MLLSKPDILRAIAEGELTITPAVRDEHIGQVSIDLSIGTRFSRFRDPPAYLAAGVTPDSSIFDSDEIWETLDQDRYTLEPNSFVLAQTLEEVKLGRSIAAMIEGRSGLARLGVGVHVTAPKIDPGFSGVIALEIANHGRLPIILRSGAERPAQLLLFRLSTPLDENQIYGTRAGDVFQYQADARGRAKR